MFEQCWLCFALASQQDYFIDPGPGQHVTVPLSIRCDRFDRSFIDGEKSSGVLVNSLSRRMEIGRTGTRELHHDRCSRVAIQLAPKCNYAKLNYNLQIRELFADVDT